VAIIFLEWLGATLHLVVKSCKIQPVLLAKSHSKTCRCQRTPAQKVQRSLVHAGFKLNISHSWANGDEEATNILSFFSAEIQSYRKLALWLFNVAMENHHF
jgi:hypothetical protein